MIYGHGDDAPLQTREIRDDFSTNLRLGGPPVSLLQHLRNRLELIAHYPDPDARTYRHKLTAAHGVSEKQLHITAGGTAAIYHIAQLFRAKRSLILTPTFSEYEDAARFHEHTLAFAPFASLGAGADFETALDAHDLVWLCNPNNPDGRVLPRDVLLALIDRHPRTTFLIDQAFADFCATEPLHAADTTSRPNLILARSLTKVLGIPGLRLGYLVAPLSHHAALTHARQPWAVNSLALEAGLFHLAHAADFALPLDDLLAHTRTLFSAINTLPGYEAQPSATHFFLVTLRRGTASALKQYLVTKHGMLVRDASNFRGLGPESIRICAKTPWQNTRLLDALKSWNP